MSQVPLSLIDIHDTLSDDLIDLIHTGNTRCDEFERMYGSKYPQIVKVYLGAVTNILDGQKMGMRESHQLILHDGASDEIMEILKENK
jgi:hypothetical protein